MSPQELKLARLQRGWSQPEAARRLGVSQSYVAMLESGRRKVTPKLGRKFMRVYGMEATVLPPSQNFKPLALDAQRFFNDLAALGYPGFEYARPQVERKNPGELLLTALAQDEVEPRLVEALPWLLLRYWRVDSGWLVEKARTFNLQNRLGFTVNLAREASRRFNRLDDQRDQALSTLEASLEESRLAREDTYLKPLRTDAERQWVEQNRTEAARHWNLLTVWRPEHLQYVP